MAEYMAHGGKLYDVSNPASPKLICTVHDYLALRQQIDTLRAALSDCLTELDIYTLGGSVIEAARDALAATEAKQ